VTAIEGVEAFRLPRALRDPYHLSFGTLHAFDLVLARVAVEEGEGVGECVPLATYSPEGPDDVWRAVVRAVPELVGRDAREAAAALEAAREDRPFAAAPLLTALEDALAPAEAQPELRVPLLATPGGRGTEDGLEEAERLADEGYATLKVKVGWDAEEDARWVRRVGERVGGRAVLRVDANQAYGFDEAVAFLSRVDPAAIELFEQPFEPGAWAAMSRLAGRSPLPLMLDESVATRADLERLVELRCASWVKFKLAKAGSGEALRRLVVRAGEAGLRTVLGNGVAGEVDNLRELRLAADLIDTAGEMNGFLKPLQPLLGNPYGVVAGHAVVPAGYAPELDWERVHAEAVDSVVAGRGESVRPALRRSRA
jgi:L-alanine-DL-glutamate epimerase-like enolase superfamily enzyme